MEFKYIDFTLDIGLHLTYTVSTQKVGKLNKCHYTGMLIGIISQLMRGKSFVNVALV